MSRQHLLTLSGRFAPEAVAGWKGQRSRVATKLEQCTCVQCGNLFLVYACRPRKFCSWTCLQKKKQTNTFVQRTCLCCRKEFTVRRIYAERGGSAGMFCSVPCMRMFRRQGVPREATTLQCVVCKKPFQIRPSTVRKGGLRFHCSLECRKRRVKVKCLTCGKEIETSATAPVRYCSVSCYRRSAAETRPEAAVRMELENLGLRFQQEAPLGHFSLDFLVERKLVIEINGRYWHRKTAGNVSMKKRSAIAAAGLKLITLSADRADDTLRLNLLRALIIRCGLNLPGKWLFGRLKK